MTNFNEIEVLLNIKQFIDKNQCGIDGFFTDSKTAAYEILMYLQREKIVMQNEGAVEIEFKIKNRAA